MDNKNYKKINSFSFLKKVFSVFIIICLLFIIWWNWVVSATNSNWIKQIAGWLYFSLILKEDGTVWAWWNNNSWQLWDGTEIDKNTLVQVKWEWWNWFLTDVKAIQTGFYHSLALKEDGTVWAWWRNLERGLWDGTEINKNTPVQVKWEWWNWFLTNVKQIRAGNWSSFALKENGTLWAWWNNFNWQLWNGGTDNRFFPTQVSGISYPIKKVTSFWNSSFALTTLWEVWSWWSNPGWILLWRTTTNNTYSGTPAKVLWSWWTGFLNNVKEIASWKQNILVIKNDWTVWAWWYNSRW